MKPILRSLLLVLVLAGFVRAQAQQPPELKPAAVVGAAVQKLLAIIEPPAGAPAQTFSATLKLTKAEGLPSIIPADSSAEIMIQAPDRLLVRHSLASVARDGQEIWVYTPDKKFGVVGQPGVPRFATNPNSIDKSQMGAIALPFAKEQLALIPFITEMAFKPEETVDNSACHVIDVALVQAAAERFNINGAKLELAIRKSDNFPVRIRIAQGKIYVELLIVNAKFTEPRLPEDWKLKSAPGDNIEKTAVSHLRRFFEVLPEALLNNKIPTLGPATGERLLVAQYENGRLENWDGTRVLFIKGTPAEMGRQQGYLLRNEVRHVTGRILYGIGVGSSFAKGKWFFGEIEQAQARLAPFISPRAYEEMDALASAVGLSKEESRLANFFPELFHCSGFAVVGDATVDGKLYHGRVLDYLKGVGLEQNAVVAVVQPDKGNAWVNIGYAGFLGSVTAMNEKRISIGEMGGRGEGNWDGKPMAQLLREVMENASTLDEAVAIMRNSKRTCEYYYVIADGNSKKAVGIKATPTIFETVALGEAHPQLTTPVKDTVLLSAGKRYDNLVSRVKQGYGKLDATGARALMEPGVCMDSNIHSVLFAPESLDFWVANADSKNVASKTRYTQYNLGEMLKATPAGKRIAGR